MPEDQKIGPTAHYTAYAWHRLRMPYAEHFATPRGRALYWTFRGAVEWMALATSRSPLLLVDVLAYRHRTIDAEIARARPTHVIELGAGLSPRGVWAVCDLGVARYVEIDLPHMIEAKRARLEALPAALRARIEGRLVQEARDILSDGFGAWLAAELRGAESAIVNAEGVLGYFDVRDRERIVRAVCEGLRAAKQGAFLCDLRDHERTRSAGYAVPVLRGAIRLVTRGRGLREDFATEADIRAFFARCGMDAAPIETPIATGVPGSPGRHDRVASASRRPPVAIWRAIPVR